jgi:hypothetical protein
LFENEKAYRLDSRIAYIAHFENFYEKRAELHQFEKLFEDFDHKLLTTCDSIGENNKNNNKNNNNNNNNNNKFNTTSLHLKILNDAAMYKSDYFIQYYFEYEFFLFILLAAIVVSFCCGFYLKKFKIMHNR